jgi:bifunctional DNA-binding transcriptional regulator/antitoxin component of YhaV-PrlF toxin-antitoxin module
MAPNGRLVIPVHIRAAMKMERGGAFVARIEDGAIKLEPHGRGDPQGAGERA